MKEKIQLFTDLHTNSLTRPAGVNGLFQVWETLLQEVEVDSAVVSEIANSLGRQVSRPLIEGTFHRKLEARKIFQHRETLENALEKAALQLDTVSQLAHLHISVTGPFFTFRVGLLTVISNIGRYGEII